MLHAQFALVSEWRAGRVLRGHGLGIGNTANDQPETGRSTQVTRGGFEEIAQRVRRGPAETIDALTRAMAIADRHEWVRSAADRLILGADILWQALCASWAKNIVGQGDKETVANPVRDALEANG